ncbi:MAG: BrnA antitoxin family protein, partial [Sulfuriferula sp.]
HTHHLSSKSHKERKSVLPRREAVKTEYDLSTMKSRKNPYAAKLKKSVTMRLSEDVIGYFKQMAEEAGVPYQSLINLYLRDCVAHHRKIDISWQTTP